MLIPNLTLPLLSGQVAGTPVEFAGVTPFGAQRNSSAGQGPQGDYEIKRDPGNALNMTTGVWTPNHNGNPAMVFGAYWWFRGAAAQIRTRLDEWGFLKAEAHFNQSHVSHGESCLAAGAHIMKTTEGTWECYATFSGDNITFGAFPLDPTIAFHATKDATFSGVATNFTKTFDLGNNFNATTGVFTAPVNGYYATAHRLAQSNTSAHFGARGVGPGQQHLSRYATGNSAHTLTGSAGVLDVRYMLAGETFYVQQEGAGSATLARISGGRISTPTAGFRAVKQSGRATSPMPGTIHDYDVVNFNIDNAFNASTGIYTVPAGQGGTWLTTYLCDMISSNLPSGTTGYVFVMKNGAQITSGNARHAQNATWQSHVRTALIISLAAGDTLQLRQDAQPSGTCQFYPQWAAVRLAD